MLGSSLNDLLLFVRGGAANEAAGVALLVLLRVDYCFVGDKSQIFRIEDPYLDTVSLVVASLVKEKVDILSLDCLCNDWHDLVFRRDLIVGVLVFHYLLL